jgi:hypothetical protein
MSILSFRSFDQNKSVLDKLYLHHLSAEETGAIKVVLGIIFRDVIKNPRMRQGQSAKDIEGRDFSVTYAIAEPSRDTKKGLRVILRSPFSLIQNYAIS